jgi:hypothetical protein
MCLWSDACNVLSNNLPISTVKEHCFLPTHSFLKTFCELLASQLADLLKVFGRPSVKHWPVGLPKDANVIFAITSVCSGHSNVTFSCSAAETQPLATLGGDGPGGGPGEEAQRASALFTTTTLQKRRVPYRYRAYLSHNEIISAAPTRQLPMPQDLEWRQAYS